MRIIKSIVTIALLLPSLALAQFGPQTGEMQVNTYTSYSQYSPKVAANATTGAFVVVWASDSQDGYGGGVFAQRFGTDGAPVGAEFQVNSYTYGTQADPAAAVNPVTGNFIVAWTDDETDRDGDQSAVFAQRFGSDGTPVGTEFQVNSYTYDGQRDPRVGIDPNSGNFIIAWESSSQDGSGIGVFAQRFVSNGSAIGNEFQVSTYTEYFQRSPVVEVLPGSGDFVIAWYSEYQDGDYEGVFAQRFDSNGAAAGTEFQVNSYTSGSQRDPAVAAVPGDDSFVVAWTSSGQDGDGRGVIAQRFDSTGTAVGGEFQVNSYTNSYQSAPAIAVEPGSGEFVVAWVSSDQDGSAEGVFAQRFTSNGAAVGTEFQVNEFVLDEQNSVTLAARGSGNFAIAWEDESGHDGCISGGFGVFGQRFASDGTPLGAEFQVNSFTLSEQRRPSVGVDSSSGNFVVAWLSYGQGGGSDVFAQRFASDGTAIGGEFLVNSYTEEAQRNPVVGAGGGTFVVAWDSFHDGYAGGIFAQRFDSNGAAAGTEFQVNTFTNSYQRYPAVAVDQNDGDFVVAWESDGQDGSNFGVFAQRYASNGSTVGGEFQANTTTVQYQSQAVVGIDPNTGAFVVSWNAFTDGDQSGVFAQRFNSDGTTAGGQFLVNSFITNRQSVPAIAVNPNTGAFVVSWDSDGQDGDGDGVFAQRFNSDGTTAGGEFQANSFTPNFQDSSAAAAAPTTGDFVVVWTSQSQDGDYYGVFGQRFASDGTPAGTEFQINTFTSSGQENASIGVMPGTGDFVVIWASHGQDGCEPSSESGVFARLYGNVAATATATVTATATMTATPTAGVGAVCPASPAMGCQVPTKGKLIIKDNTDDTKDKLVWKFGKGPLLTQADFGNPVTTDGYAFCVYDDGTLKVDLTIPAGMPWEALSTKGYQYKDSAGVNDSVTKVKLIGGDVGKSKLQLKGKGMGLGVPAPVSGTQLLSGTMAVTVQLHGNGDCWETSFTTPQSKHKANLYKGKF